MATVTKKDRTLRVIYTVGTNTDGKPMLKTQSYARINRNLTDDQCYDFAQLLLTVQAYPGEVEKRDTVSLEA